MSNVERDNCSSKTYSSISPTAVVGVATVAMEQVDVQRLPQRPCLGGPEDTNDRDRREVTLNDTLNFQSVFIQWRNSNTTTFGAGIWSRTFGHMDREASTGTTTATANHYYCSATCTKPQYSL